METAPPASCQGVQDPLTARSCGQEGQLMRHAAHIRTCMRGGRCQTLRTKTSASLSSSNKEQADSAAPQTAEQCVTSHQRSPVSKVAPCMSPGRGPGWGKQPDAQGCSAHQWAKWLPAFPPLPGEDPSAPQLRLQLSRTASCSIWMSRRLSWAGPGAGWAAPSAAEGLLPCAPPPHAGACRQYR